MKEEKRSEEELSRRAEADAMGAVIRGEDGVVKYDGREAAGIKPVMVEEKKP